MTMFVTCSVWFRAIFTWKRLVSEARSELVRAFFRRNGCSSRLCWLVACSDWSWAFSENGLSPKYIRNIFGSSKYWLKAPNACNLARLCTATKTDITQMLFPLIFGGVFKFLSILKWPQSGTNLISVQFVHSL